MPAGSNITLLKRFLAKAEGVGSYGVDPTLVAATDGLRLLAGPTLNPDVQNHPLDTEHATGGISEHYKGNAFTQFDFSLKCTGAGETAGVADTPRWERLLEACCWKGTVNVNDIDYTPRSVANDSCYIKLWEMSDGVADAGNLIEIPGWRGQASLVFEAGKPIIWEFKGKGKYVRPDYDTIVAVPTLDEEPVLSALGLTITINGDTYRISKIRFDNNVEFSDIMDAGDSTGFGEFQCTRKGVTGSFTTMATHEDAAVREDWAVLEACTGVAFSMTTIGSTGGNKFTVTGSKMTFTKITRGRQNGLITRDVTFGLEETSGDDELTVKLLGT